MTEYLYHESSDVGVAMYLVLATLDVLPASPSLATFFFRSFTATDDDFLFFFIFFLTAATSGITYRSFSQNLFSPHEITVQVLRRSCKSGSRLSVCSSVVRRNITLFLLRVIRVCSKDACNDARNSGLSHSF